MKKQLSDIKVYYNHKYIKIKKHPYYLALKYHSKELYLRYIKTSFVQSKKKTGNWQGFLELLDKIKSKGFNNKKDSIVIDGDLICKHGRHRICMFMYLYGGNTLLKIKNNRLEKVYI